MQNQTLKSIVMLWESFRVILMEAYKIGFAFFWFIYDFLWIF
jgi:hypothetical protein